ncbi:Ger(x)C family spore germination protein [Salicibibacter cibarius]|uniref:Ger(X)C family spore germination protein n=1 Tax=Salicibibacter cibarius TaxID=2743000 RepID=A0A7T6Z244_9BACI|nr:Ger(x)C family spore germination protein [Salicibibacter cibarius]QQK74906.1 Ger(x)C family spore germination protein [Salicibibacter cibarius]
MIKRMCIFSLALVFFVGGCSPQVNYVEEIQYIQAMGHDFEEGEHLVTGLTTIFTAAEDTLPENHAINVSGESLETLYDSLQADSPRYVDTGRTRVHLFHEDFAAQEGVFRVLDTVQRNPMINQDMKVAITREPAREMLESEYAFQLPIFRYIQNVIEWNQKEQMPHTSLHDFMYNYYAEGADPYLPLLEKQEDNVRVAGLALFQGDMFVDEITLEEMQTFRSLIESTDGGTFHVKLNENDGVTFHHISSNPNWTINQEPDGTHVQVDVEMEGGIRQAYGIEGYEQENMEKLKQLATEEFERRMNEVIQSFQGRNIDPIGIGERVGQNVRGLDIQQWEEEAYPDVDVDVNVDFTIDNTGAVE